MTQHYSCGECGIGLSTYAMENQITCRTHQGFLYINRMNLTDIDLVVCEIRPSPAYPGEKEPYTYSWPHYTLSDKFEELFGDKLDQFSGIYKNEARRYGFT